MAKDFQFLFQIQQRYKECMNKPLSSTSKTVKLFYISVIGYKYFSLSIIKKKRKKMNTSVVTKGENMYFSNFSIGDVSMRLTVTNGGLTATTKDHGLTEYWAHRVTYCTAPASHPRLFVWVYRHEGRRLRPELRCHAALCSKESTARRLASTLNARLQQALLEFRRDKVSRQNAR